MIPLHNAHVDDMEGFHYWQSRWVHKYRLLGYVVPLRDWHVGNANGCRKTCRQVQRLEEKSQWVYNKSA